MFKIFKIKAFKILILKLNGQKFLNLLQSMQNYIKINLLKLKKKEGGKLNR